MAQVEEAERMASDPVTQLPAFHAEEGLDPERASDYLQPSQPAIAA